MRPTTNNDHHNDSDNTTPPQQPMVEKRPEDEGKPRDAAMLTELVPPSRFLAGTGASSIEPKSLTDLSDVTSLAGRRHVYGDVNGCYPREVSYPGEDSSYYHYEAVAGDGCPQSVTDSDGGYHSPGSSPYSFPHEQRPSVAVPAAIVNSPHSTDWVPHSWDNSKVQERGAGSYATSPLLRGDAFGQSPSSGHNYEDSSPASHQRAHLALHDNRVGFQGFQEAAKALDLEHRQQILDHLRTNQESIQDQENVDSSDYHQAASGSKKRRRRVQTVTQRKAANLRERKRMCHLNVAFDSLKEHLPNIRNRKKLSRIQTLRAAIYYIHLLSECLHSA
ncbi:uncharacterized protein LOC112565221 [Pomacea canaliculata]|uniref:uncharacterized protein LOC112565221 n=1 Tax=Pomacea canaliculata TaxID=400727 RepID=UPI000D7398D5|nr:uncharacterized protein LOC112565221 [Pomacea canaliculata]XP_025096343.1 uncharacterized protein LOC112565221 [Pomacea canaliculata]